MKELDLQQLEEQIRIDFEIVRDEIIENEEGIAANLAELDIIHTIINSRGTPLMKFTPEGGLAIRLTNDTGADTFKGAVVETSASVASAFDLVGIGDPDPIGIVYDDGIADGALCWVVISGIAEVFYVGSTSLHQFARVTVGGDVGAAAGKAIAEAVPTPPFATDKHFQEIGHLIEARTGAGLAKTVIHFN